MHRACLQHLLKSYCPSNPYEERIKADMLDFLALHPDCFERSLKEGHFTASAWLLSPDKNKALLMHHAKLDLWCQLGGHCDGDSDLLSVALKEAAEESGIPEIRPIQREVFDLDIHLIPATSENPAHYHYDVRFLLQATSEQVIANRESKQLLWISQDPSHLPTQEPSIVRMFNKWRL